MYYIFALLSGILIAFMVPINGGLAAAYSLHWAAVYIHVSGLLVISAWVFLKRERPFAVRHPWFLYIGGAIGVLVVLFHNLAFGRISVSAILALVLLGQSVTGLAIDHFGLFGMPQHRFGRGNLVGIALILCGIAPMLTEFELVAVALAFAAGICIVLSRTFNAKLSSVSSIRIGTFFNYLVGLAVALPIYFLFDGGETSFWGVTLSFDWYIYVGGFVGVAVIAMSNVIVVKIAAFYLTLLIFVGQVFTGILIDAALDGAFSIQLFFGGALVAAGLVANLLLDRRKKSGGSKDLTEPPVS